MKKIVQKYGGTSLASAEHLAAAARRIAAERRGRRLAVVVSAMGADTDRLLELANQVRPDADGPALDALLAAGEQISAAALCLALENIGVAARCHNALQLPIKSDGVYNDASIRDIDTRRIHEDWEAKRIAVVTGYQGVDDDKNLNTLGRGGSDASAVALAAALGADECQIYTDVDGVCTADPRIVDKARVLKSVDFEEMLELAGQGARVLQTRCVELAGACAMPLRVRRSDGDGDGTLISYPQPRAPKRAAATATSIEHQDDEAEVSLFGIDDAPGSAARVLKALGDAKLNVDVIVQSTTLDGRASLSFTVARRDLKKARALIGEIAQASNARLSADDDAGVAKLAVVSRGGRSRAATAGRMFKALADADVNIRMISTSETRIAAVVEKGAAAKAHKALRDAFNAKLEPPPKAASAASAPITGIAYRADEAKLTIIGVPDRPGVAARALEMLSDDGLEVDMIAQSVAANGDTQLSFTVARDDLKAALAAAKRAVKAIGAGRVLPADKNVAKVSVVGRGMRERPGVAGRMFEALAQDGVNLDMICTSEIKIAVIIKRDFLELAVRSLHDAFNLDAERLGGAKS